MITTVFRRVRGVAAAVVIGAALLGGCSYAVMPRSVPLARGAEELSLAAAAVLVTNAEKDSSLNNVVDDGGRSTGLKADRQAWSRKLVEALARELARRGARVSSTAPVTLSVSLPEIVFVESRDRYEMRVKAAVSSSTGWSKDYEGRAGSDRRSVLSATAEADRLAGQAMAEAVAAMLRDAEFQGQILKGPPAP